MKNLIQQGLALRELLRERILVLDGAMGTMLQQENLTAADFGVIFAYPWPDEEKALGQLFDRHAAAGAVLVTYHGGDEFCLRRKAR